MLPLARRPIVFVVDDDESVRNSLGRILRAEGFETRLFGSVERFLEQAASVTGACLVLGIALTHPEVIRFKDDLMRQGSRMPVIVVSAKDDEATRRDAKRRGARLFFRKPIDERALIDAIDWAVTPENHESA